MYFSAILQELTQTLLLSYEDIKCISDVVCHGAWIEMLKQFCPRMTRLNPDSFSALPKILQSSFLVQVVMSIFTLLKVGLNSSVCNIAVCSADMPS